MVLSEKMLSGFMCVSPKLVPTTLAEEYLHIMWGRK